MALDIWLRTIRIVRKETCCRHIGYSFQLTARVLLYAPSHRQDCTYHSLCYTSRGSLAGTRNSSMGPHHERTLLPRSYISLPVIPPSHTLIISSTWEVGHLKTASSTVQIKGNSNLLLYLAMFPQVSII